jgi:hypothetical protein
MLRRFCPKMTAKKAQEIYRQRKDRNRSWAKHHGMLLHVGALMEDNEQYVVENLVKFAMPSITALLMPHYDILRRDYKQMAEEIATYAEAYDSERVPVDYQARTGPRDCHTDKWGHRYHGHRVNSFRRDENKDQNSNRQCYKCQKIGHI